MIFEIIVENHLMNESDITRPIIFGFRLRKRDMEFEIRELLFDLLELLFIENLAPASRTVPESYRLVSLFRLEQVEVMRPQGGLTRTAAEKHLLIGGILHEESPERPGYGNFISRFQ